jgi:hypothetical protein
MSQVFQNIACYTGHIFRLDSDGVVGVDPPFTGEEADPLAWSIRKWEFIVGCLEIGCEVTFDGAHATCALCVRYYRVGCRPYCSGCPVRKFTQQGNCISTPMAIWSSDFHTLITAQAELYFLLALQEYYDESRHFLGR